MLRREKRLTVLVFLGFFLIYLSLSPGSVLDQGYMPGHLRSTTLLVDGFLKYWIKFQPTPEPIWIPNNGVIEPILATPFVMASRLLFGESAEWADRFLSLQSVLLTALLCTLIFVWVRRIPSSPRIGLAFAAIAGFTTMLWPYAYINMETTQSFFLLLAAYLSLGTWRKYRDLGEESVPGRGDLPSEGQPILYSDAPTGVSRLEADATSKRSWVSGVAFGLCCGLAVSAKAAGVLLWPAVGWLLIWYYRDQYGESWLKSRAYWRRTLATALLPAAIFSCALLTRPHHHQDVVSESLVGPIHALLNALSFFGSINKGLFVYCPVLLASFLCLETAFAKDRRLVIFALLAVAGIVAGCSVVYWWSEDTWGPRYLHCTIAPLLICLALAWNRITARMHRRILFAVLILAGLTVSFLGALFEYHSLHVVAIYSSPSNIEQLQYDVNWNPLWFDLRLLRIWLSGAKGGPNDSWPPPLHKWATIPENQIEFLRPMDISRWAVPQALLIKTWRTWPARSDLVLWCICALSLAAGPVTLAYVAYQISPRKTRERVEPAPECESSYPPGGPATSNTEKSPAADL